MKKSTLISKGFLGTACLASILGYGLAGNAAVLKNPVSIELALLIDGSESISDQDFDDQIDALNNIFNDPNFYNQYVLPLKGLEVQDHKTRKPDTPPIVINDPSVAVSIFQFGSEINPNDGTAGDPIFEQIVDWTVFDEQHQSGIASLNPSTINKVGGLTPIGGIIGMMVDELLDNAYNGDMVVNLSSDGFDTFSSATLSEATRYAFRKGVTFNALVVPATLSEKVTSTSDDLYDLSTLERIVDRYPNMNPQRKNNNLTGNPAFIMLDYATGEKTLEEAFRLKLGLETIGTAPPPIEPPTTDPQGDPEADPQADPEKVPEPSSLLGLLMISVLGLLGHHKKA